MSDSFAGFGGSGWTNAWGSSGGAYAPSATAGASDWSKILSAISSKEGQQAMGGIGKSLMTAGTGNDAAYLRTNAGQAPFSPGGTNSLLGTLLQMRQQQQLQQQFPLGQNFRPSLLG
ncbi:MAG TPA: hypothetical protein VGR63_15290 [Casimicrobiaceae bacterium]|jgi:hypothetical protein|nr:hypothetical protein [Casimicrobiaceae bacterium]